MCGIVGVVASEQTWDGTGDIQTLVVPSLDEALRRLQTTVSDADLVACLEAAAKEVGAVQGLLAGPRGVVCVAHAAEMLPIYQSKLDEIWGRIEAFEADLDEHGAIDVDIERVNAALEKLKDLTWRVRSDHLRIAAGAIYLAGADASPHTTGLFSMISIALSAIDRIEVRGRDSAGIAVVVRDHGLDLSSPEIRSMIEARSADPLLPSMSVREGGGNLCFVYKAAAEVGELGDNTRKIRAEIWSDHFIHRVLASPDARVIVLGHTRWASVGMISEPNAHPLASDEGPVTLAVLNGDIDNHADIRAAEGFEFPREITTDTKIIPALMSRRITDGLDVAEAFRRTVSVFEGSTAIGAISLLQPDRLFLALRGSGQALYVGLSDLGYVVASEPYGSVEQASAYVRMEGEGDTRGQIVVVTEPTHGGTDGLIRRSYDGTELPIGDGDVKGAEITTRDVDRGPYPHFLLKELLSSPRSFRKTLRGRLVGAGDEARVVLGEEALPRELIDKLTSGAITRITVIGQGSAAIAGRAVGVTLAAALDPSPVDVAAMAATELSGFGLRDDMSDTLVVAISQSGTTADTNRTVEVARGRGAYILAIVNRRQSDLTDRADAVLYTSDGRDVEMAVPSTKAFYAQVAAGFLLSAALADHVDGATGVDPSVLEALRALPDAMEQVVAIRPQIAEVAQRHVTSRRDWAIVGNGANRIAAEEVRIKLSELCYKSISCDSTEDKKHIDLSAEPLILVCAAGLQGSNAEDVAKEVVYYRAHKAAPIVICGEGEGRYEAALDVIRVPSLHPAVAFVLSTMAGHIFGYEAALAIDALAQPLREARSLIEAATETTSDVDPMALLDSVRPQLAPIGNRFREGLRAGNLDGHLEPSTAVRIASLFRYATGMTPLDAYQIEYGKVGTPSEVLRDLLTALTVGIDRLTRPIDAIRHQAKTVTVGISRAEETLLGVRLVQEVLTAGVARDRLSYNSMRALAALDASVDRIAGYTLYRIEGDPGTYDATVHITDRGGIARDIPSRTDRDPALRGTKHRVAVEREVLVTRGHDNRTLVMVPEVKGGEVTGLVLLHVAFHERLPSDVMRPVLQGYRDRYSALRDLVTETEPTFRDDVLAEIEVADLLIESIQVLARKWRTT